MKYTARHIQRFLETGKIDATLWKNHFPTLLPTQVPTCEECGEFKDRTCAGGRDPVECFLDKTPGRGAGGRTPDRRSGTRCSALVQKRRVFAARQSPKTSRRCDKPGHQRAA